MLNEFTAWQWELAIISSRFSLGLLSNDEIITFTHQLMDNGYYNDVMLDIIDNTQHYITIEQLLKTFTDFNNACIQWLTRNQPKIPQIMHQIFRN